MNATTSARTSIAAPEHTHGNRPEFFRMPKAGGDPHFGLSRSHYYELERAGKLNLVRLRRPGATRGVVLIPFAAVKALIEAAAN